ncbi:MAG: hypothetical protein OQK24_06890 [Magnetovibrio sp.]|nr:hypothetical protein [Magnetovibrio sp.]
MSWPHREDGTVDWETVFEDKETGLVGFVKATKSPEALARCAHVIVNSLFIRENDVSYRVAYDAAIDELIKNKDDQSRDKLLKVIHEIKHNRMERVKSYLDDKTSNSEERRLHEDDPTAPLEILQDD